MIVAKAFQHNLIKILIFLIGWTYSTSAFSVTCSDYFARKSWTPKQLLFQEILEKETPITGIEWIEYLRFFTERPDAFTGADTASFRFFPGSGYYSKGDKNGENWARHLRMPQLKSWRITRNSHIEIPQAIPQNKSEAATFMIELAYSLQRYHQNLHADLLSNRIPLDRSTLNAKLDLLNQRKEDLKKSNLSLLQKKLLSIKIKFTELYVRLSFEIQQRTPFSYSRHLHRVIAQYDRDILILYEELQALLESPLAISMQSYKERSQWISYTSAIFASLSKFIFPFSFYKPLDSRILDYNNLKKANSEQNTQAQALSKWFSDKLTTFSLALYLSASWHFGNNLPHNIENLSKFVSYISSIDKPKIMETAISALSQQEKKTPLEVHQEFLFKQEELVKHLQEQLQAPELTPEQIEKLSLRIEMHENLIAEEVSTWRNYNGQ